jgi:hypothetical protein
MVIQSILKRVAPELDSAISNKKSQFFCRIFQDISFAVSTAIQILTWSILEIRPKIHYCVIGLFRNWVLTRDSYFFQVFHHISYSDFNCFPMKSRNLQQSYRFSEHHTPSTYNREPTLYKCKIPFIFNY